MFFVDREFVFDEEFAEFFFQSFGAVVFTLVADVGGEGVELGLAEEEGAVAALS